MNEYTVFYSVVGQWNDRLYSGYRCMAEDTVHAINQTIDAVLSEDEVIDYISKVEEQENTDE
tara:strand:- start:317 stop:502 length:186 start_codon:yes stop_codon:yes gene_type:complete